MPSQEAVEQYTQACRQAYKEIKEFSSAGKSPAPAVLDELLPGAVIDSYQEIGLTEIPAERIIGTRSAGRITAFSPGFLPLLDADTEFASKWMSLCDAHLSDEGIRDPILCYEYLGDFYVQEGNKRVSVLRSFGAPLIPGIVRRIIPAPCDDPRIKAYYEFLDFYRDSGLYEVQYRKPGDYARLLAALGKTSGQKWSQQEQRTFTAYLQYFREAFHALGGDSLGIAPEEALLLWLKVYTFGNLGEMTASQLKKALSGLWTDLKVLVQDTPMQVSTAPVSDSARTGLLNWLLPGPERICVAFIHQRTPQTSTWTKSHDDSRCYLEQYMGRRVAVRSYYGADTPEDADALLEQAVSEGAELIFTTSAQLNQPTLKAAVKYPRLRFFNCSVAMPYTSVRSYYCRAFEGKFITGAIAGAMSKNDCIGYIGSYPIFGEPASINAFALGAQMTNPNARIALRWDCLPGDPVQELIDLGCKVISNRDVPVPFKNYLEQGHYGTYLVEADRSLTPLASPCWLWGEFYVRIVRSILSGTWEQGKESHKAMNYWWGMDSGVIEIEFSNTLPESLRCLVHLLRSCLQQGTLDIFHRHITARDGTVINDGSRYLSPEQLLHMDWLCDNVDGCIPEFDTLLPSAQPLVRTLGVYKDRIPPQKEAQPE